MKPNAFDVLKIMSEKNLDISAAVELTNFVRQEKKKGGLVTVGVADPTFTHLINQAALGERTHQAVLLVYSIEQYKETEQAIKGEL